MATQWTDKQQETIAHREGHLLVSASAGSGKTAVLIERIYELLAEGLDPMELLVVTFTNAAAEEMRSRLIDRLSRSGEEALLDKAQRLEEAQVSTLHSFCGDVVRAHYDVVDIDPAFRLMDASDAKNRFDLALREALEQAYAQPSVDFAALDAHYGPYDRLSDYAEALYSFARDQADPSAWLAQAAELYGAEGIALWRRECLQATAVAIKNAQSLLEEACAIADTSGFGPQAQQLSEEADALAEAARMLREGEGAALLGVSFARMAAIRGEAEGKEEMQALRKSAKSIVEKQKKSLDILQEGAEDIEALAPAMRGLAALVLACGAIYQQRKREQGLLDFSDLEHFALEILRRPDIAEEYRARFRYIFVDEYQDISPVQDALIFALARADNVFLVGDIKQSIYRFRHAEPGLFLEKQERWRDGEEGHRIILGHNFRSRSNVLAGINALFSRIMRKDEAEIEYTAEEHLQYGAQYSGEDPPIRLHLLDKKSLEGLTASEGEALVIASQARTLHAQGVSYRDMAVLLRATAPAPIMQDILLAQGIPALSDVSAGFFEVWEVRSFIALLRLLQNMRSDIPLLAVLRVFGHFSENELARMRLSHPADSFCDAFLAAAETEDAARDFLARIDIWREWAQRMHVSDLMTALLEDTDYFYRLDALPGGAARKANLRSLLAMAQDFSARREGSLAQFLDFADKLERRGDSPEPARLGQEDDILRIMSIHKSKGLEFPVVFLAGMGRKFAVSHRVAIDIHSDLGFALPYQEKEPHFRRRTMAQSAIRWRQFKEMIAEEARLLYVAMTRAREHLHLLGTQSGPALPSEGFSLLLAGSYLDMLLGALPFPAEPSGKHVFDGAVFDCSSYSGDWETAAPAASKAEEQGPLLLPDSLRFSYESAALQPPEKVTVTQLRQALAEWTLPDDDPLPSALFEAQQLSQPLRTALPTPLERPSLLSEEKGFTAAQRGSLVHGLLGHISLEALRSAADLDAALKNEIVSMQEKGLYTAEEAEAIELPLLQRFFESELGRRMLASPRILREQPFNLQLSAEDFDADFPRESMLLQGVIDLCFEEEGGWVLVEYKTDRAPLAEIAQLYHKQLYWYARALEALTPLPVKQAYIYALRHSAAYASIS